MNVNLTRVFNVPVVVVSERYDHFRMVNYNIVVDMTTASADNQELNTAFARMKYWLYEIMHSSVVISHDHPRLNSWQDTGSRLLIFPEEPVDQIVGIVLFRKLTAMVEQRLTISRVSISSHLDDDMIYHHDEDEPQGGVSHSGWWCDARPTWYNDVSKSRRNSKVININRQPEWRDHDLDWDSVDSDESVTFQADD